MPDPAQPKAQISETGQGAPVPAATAASLETVRAVNQAAHLVRVVEPVIELSGLA